MVVLYLYMKGQQAHAKDILFFQEADFFFFLLMFESVFELGVWLD